MNNKIKNIGLLLAVSVIGLSSCDDKAEEITSVNYTRNFSVVKIDIQQNQTNAVLSWDKSLSSTNETKYTIIVSQDSLFTNGPEKTFESATNNLTIPDSEIQVRKDYYARIKANSEGEKGESLWSHSKKFKITGEQYLKAIKYENITSTTVDINWTIPNNVTHLTLNGTRYDITTGEKATGQKKISNLTPSTTYDVIIFNETADKGTASFTTKAGVPSGNIINVTAADFEAKLTAATNGDIFVLKQGEKYILNANITLPSGAITLFGEEGPNKPLINVVGQINLPTSASVIKFQNIHFSGYENGDVSKTKRNYIFNQSAACTVDEIIFENCEIRHLTNSPFRLQGTTNKVITKLNFDHCVVENIGDNGSNGSYAFISNNVANSIIKNISITNSTFSKIGYALILHNASASETVTIDNCTLYNVIGDGRILIDYNNASFGTLNINNSIIAKSLSPAATAGGIRGAGEKTITNTYKTTDLVVSATTPLTGIKDYTGTSSALFVSPSTGDFKILDASFAGKLTAGDPRWR